DVVFEGGNAAANTEFVDNFASLELLTTSASSHRQFWTTNATSVTPGAVPVAKVAHVNSSHEF
uniref:hypothetical protein n=1 Tax=Klebsiella pneumoniae TaxID=573 RepID=UPI001F3167A2